MMRERSERSAVAATAEANLPSWLRDESPTLWEPRYGPVARQLLTSGVRCFAAHGFHATTTRDITSAIGLSPGGLYVHFSSKEQLLFEIVSTAHRSLLETIQLASTSDAPVSHLRELVTSFVGWHAKHHVAARVSQYELAALSHDHRDEILELRRQSTAIFRDAMVRGVEGEKFEDLDVSRVARAILSLGVDLVRWYRLDGRDSPAELGAFYADLVERMVVRRQPEM